MINMYIITCVYNIVYVYIYNVHTYTVYIHMIYLHQKDIAISTMAGDLPIWCCLNPETRNH